MSASAASAAIRVIRLQQETLRLLLAEAEARLGLHQEECSVGLNKNRVWRAREKLDEADGLLDDLAEARR